MGTREDLISEGTFKDGKLRFVINSGPPGQQRRVTYEGAVEGSRITLASQIPGREPIKGLAERSKPEAALPPPRLPLPQLHDVPDNGLARTPPMGWNSWNKFAGRIDDAA